MSILFEHFPLLRSRSLCVFHFLNSSFVVDYTLNDHTVEVVCSEAVHARQSSQTNLLVTPPVIDIIYCCLSRLEIP